MVSPIHIALGAVAVGGVSKAYDHWKYSTHDRYVKSTYKQVADATDSDADVYVDLPKAGDGGTEGIVDDLGCKAPDLIIRDFPEHLIVEVEDENGLNDRSHVVDQLNNYRADGYSRILVAPDDEELQATAEKYAEAASGSVQVKTPESLGEYLL